MAIAAAPAAAEGLSGAAGRRAAKKAAGDAAAAKATKSTGPDPAPGRTGGGTGGGGGQKRSTGQKTHSSSRGRRPLAWAWSGNRRVLTAEFVLCVVVLILGALTADEKETATVAPRTLVKGSALALLFFLLALLTAGGKGGAKTATAVGTLVTVAYVFTSSDVRSVVTFIGSFFGGAKTRFPAPKSAVEASEENNAPPFDGGTAQ